jgi:competence protein ComEC
MIAHFKSEIPFFRYIWYYILGILTMIYWPNQPILLFKYSLSLLLVALISFIIYSKKSKNYKHHLAGLLICVFLYFSGILFCYQYQDIYHPHHFSKIESKNLVVTINETPRLKGDIARFIVIVNSAISKDNNFSTKGKLLLAMRFDTTQIFDLKYGDQLVIKSKFTETEPPYNPAEFNYKRYLTYHNIHHQSFIHLQQTKRTASKKGNPIIGFALDFREQQVEKFRKYLDYKDAQAVASTLILGYRAEIDQQIIDTYSKTGTLHILSVSGMHVAIVVLLIDFLLGFLNRYKHGKLVKLLLMLGLIWFYSLITGLAPSILRAALMLSFVLIGRYKRVKTNTFNIIALAAIIILLNNPLSIMDVRFQLSLLAVLGLIYIYPKIYSIYHAKYKLIDICWQCVSVSIAAQIATTPLSIYYFHQFPVYFMFSNVYMLLPAVIIMYFGIGFLFCSIFPEIIMKGLGFMLNHLIDLTNKGLTLIEQFPYASVTQIWISKTETLLFYTIIILLLSSAKHINYLRSAYLLIFIWCITSTYSFYSKINQQNIIFFSLRKNSTVAILKGRTALLITDLESSDPTYQFSVNPYLDSCGIKNITFTNPHLQKGESNYYFENKYLKILTQQSNNFSNSLSNWLMISGDKVYDIHKLLENNKTENLFIDAKNRDYIIKSLENELINSGFSSYTLKRNKAISLNY